ncbi:hypothetical protein BH11PLA1_BH11PLA1_23090 [soil metagenome]
MNHIPYQLIVVVIFLAFSGIQVVLRKLQQQAALKREREQVDAARLETLRTGRSAGGEAPTMAAPSMSPPRATASTMMAESGANERERLQALAERREQLKRVREREQSPQRRAAQATGAAPGIPGVLAAAAAARAGSAGGGALRGMPGSSGAMGLIETVRRAQAAAKAQVQAAAEKRAFEARRQSEAQAAAQRGGGGGESRRAKARSAARQFDDQEARRRQVEQARRATQAALSELEQGEGNIAAIRSVSSIDDERAAARVELPRTTDQWRAAIIASELLGVPLGLRE